MAALFKGLFMTATVATPEPTTPSQSAKRGSSISSNQDPQLLIQSPRSYHMPAYPMTSEWDERERRSSTRVGATTESRIAHWDKKREKCANCKHIYLKTLSRHAGFCSVDCKSNAAYVDKVNRTIKAVRNAVERKQQDKTEDDVQRERSCNHTTTTTDDSELDTESECEDDEEDAATQARTFADFGLESRMPVDQKVEWAFSAMY